MRRLRAACLAGLVTLLPGALLAAAPLLLTGCSSGIEPTAEVQSDMQADQIMVHVKQWLTKDGVRAALVQADTAFVYQDSSMVHAKGVHVIMYDEQGNVNGDLTSQTGDINMRTEAMIAWGNVVLVNQQTNRRIETEELHYDPQSDRIWSDVATTMTENGTVVHGTGFNSDTQFTKVHVQNPRGTTQGVKVQH
jgi:LPS export ABC transporter protein LptC